MPIDRVLIESDGPFAQVDGRAAWPWEAVTAIPDLAKLWRIDEGDCERQLMANLAAIGKIAVSPQFQ
jgi:TatD DNase family protein